MKSIRRLRSKKNKTKKYKKKRGGASKNEPAGIGEIISVIKNFFNLKHIVNESNLNKKIKDILMSGTTFSRDYVELEEDKEYSYITDEEYNSLFIKLLKKFDILPLIINEITEKIASLYNHYDRPPEYPLSDIQKKNISLILTPHFIEQYRLIPHIDYDSLIKLLKDNNIDLFLIMYPNYDITANICITIKYYKKKGVPTYTHNMIKEASLKITREFIHDYKTQVSVINSLDEQITPLFRLLRHYNLYDVFHIEKKLSE